jgi:hypothetical protein
MVELLPLR